MSELRGTRWRTLRAGSVRSLDLISLVARSVASQPDAVFPVWQGMQYTRDSFAGLAKLETLDNERYPDIRWTRTPAVLAGIR